MSAENDKLLPLPHPDVRILTREEIRRQGPYFLRDNETIMLDPKPDNTLQQTIPGIMSDGTRFQSTDYSLINVGQSHIAAIGEYTFFDDSGQPVIKDMRTPSYFIRLYPLDAEDINEVDWSHLIEMTPGRTVHVGRLIEGQDDLGEIVSDHQFDVEADPYGWITLTNASPSNPTSIEGFF